MSFGLVTISALLFYYLVDRMAGKRRQHELFSRHCRPPVINPSDIVVRGSDLQLTDEAVHLILLKRFGYYRQLKPENQRFFLYRLQRFISRKMYVIKDNEGFREMPVLISAAAIQLTFGLSDYLLSFYRYIRIYPAEFVSDDLTRILAGNVSNNTITVAWNHFLQGYHHEQDGANLGLHEMSHALYFQKVEVEQEYAKSFTRQFAALNEICQHAFETEIAGTKNLYSKYAEKNLQEFWAESVELFFEKPLALQAHYPDVFDRMVALLNQNPAVKEDPVVLKQKAVPLHIRPLQSVTQARQRLLNRR